MSDLSAVIKNLILEIKNTEEYKKYQFCENKLLENRELRGNIDKFRAKVYFANMEDNQVGIHKELQDEGNYLIENKLAYEYLDSELDLCKLLQRLFNEIVDGIDFRTPN